MSEVLVKQKNYLGEIAASLELMGNWILQIAHKENPKFQKKVLAIIIPDF